MSKYEWQTETVRFDATDTGRVFDRLIREFGSPFKVNEIAGNTALEAMQLAHAQGRDPGTGAYWKALAPNTRLQKGHARPLFKTGRTFESFEKGRPGNVFLISARRAKIGSRLKTAVFAQEGTRAHTIKARRKPFLVFRTTQGMIRTKSVAHPGTVARPVVGVSPGTLGEIDRRINRYLDDIQREAGATG